MDDKTEIMYVLVWICVSSMFYAVGRFCRTINDARPEDGSTLSLILALSASGSHAILCGIMGFSLIFQTLSC